MTGDELVRFWMSGGSDMSLQMEYRTKSICVAIGSLP